MRRRVAIALIALIAALAAGVAITRSGRTIVRGASRLHQLSFGRDVYQYVVDVPTNHRPGTTMPLVVVLHGCTMSAAEQAAAAGYDQIAAARGFAVLYPDVDAIDRTNGRCWKAIWDPQAEGRGRGDAGAIAAMTREVIARWSIDPRRVYVIGISAGAFEVSRLGAAYPDVYAAIGIHSGGGYLGVEDGCLVGSSGSTETAARAALAAMGSHARVMPVIVFHGDRDGTVPYRCGQQALAQWLATDDLILRRAHSAPLPASASESSHPAVSGKRPYSVFSYTESSGCSIAQLWSIHGMGHYWSGGSADPTSLRYSDPRGPSASAASWAFFSDWRRSAHGLRCAPDNAAGNRARR